MQRRMGLHPNPLPLPPRRQRDRGQNLYHVAFIKQTVGRIPRILPEHWWRRCMISVVAEFIANNLLIEMNFLLFNDHTEASPKTNVP